MARISMLAAALVMVLAACGAAGGDVAVVGDDGVLPVSDADDGAAGGAAGMCPAGTTDCVDTPELLDDEPVEIDETGIEQFRRDAQAILGWEESEISELIRIGRRGEEQFALTEDYQVGRITAELDDPDGDGTYVVTKTTVELPDGPETFELDA